MADNDLSNRIDQYLSQHRQPVDESLKAKADDPAIEESANRIRAALSGAFGQAIDVFIGEGEDAGAFLAEIPLSHLKSCGVKMVESVVRPRVGSRDKGRCPAIVGSTEALQNAERRVAKPLGEGWKVTVDSFPCHVGANESLYFRVQKA